MTDKKLQQEAGRKLAEDLRTLREDKKVSFEAVVKATRLTDDILRQFEETALIGHPAFNRVYLHSILSSYGRLLGLDPSVTSRALDAALSGVYSGLESKPPPVVPDETPAPGKDVPHFEFSDFDNQFEPVTEDLSHSKSLFSSFLGRTTVDRSDDRKPRIKRFRGILLPRHRSLIPTLAVAVVLILLVLWLLFGRDGSPVPSNPAADIVPADTVSTVQTPVHVQLPDSLAFDIVAVMEKLDPIRVQVDDGIRRPYWVEVGDTIRFVVKDSIRVEREAAAASVFVQGHPVPPSLIDSLGVLRVDRQWVQNWLDSLALQNTRGNELDA